MDPLAKYFDTMSKNQSKICLLNSTSNLFENNDIKVVIRSAMLESRQLKSTIFFCNKTASSIQDCQVYFESQAAEAEFLRNHEVEPKIFKFDIPARQTIK